MFCQKTITLGLIHNDITVSFRLLATRPRQFHFLKVKKVHFPHLHFLAIAQIDCNRVDYCTHKQ